MTQETILKVLKGRLKKITYYPRSGDGLESTKQFCKELANTLTCKIEFMFNSDTYLVDEDGNCARIINKS